MHILSLICFNNETTLKPLTQESISMSEANPNKADNREFPAVDIYNEDGVISGQFLEAVENAVLENNALFLDENVASLHPSELGHLIDALEPEQRPELIMQLGESFDFTALTEVDEAVRLEIMDALPTQQIVEGVQDIDSDDAVYLLEDLDDDDRQEILAKLPFTEQVRLRRSLDFPEESAGRRMQTEFVAVPPFWTIGQVIDYMREEQNLPDHFSQIFVIDATFRLMGSLDLDRLLRTQRPVRVDEVMHEARHVIPATMDQEEAAQIFGQYDLLSAAVVDENDRLLGVLTIDDVVDVIQQEAEEDLMRMGGVGDEELSDSVLSTAKSRLPWLSVNLLTALASASIISIFDGTIKEMVALAALMPIVASMGGNAATQTMTVTVRAVATKDIDIYNAARVIRRELTIGLLNGTLFALLIGTAAGLHYWSADLGCIIAAAMVINMLAAALGGILTPLLLNRFGADPAIASSVFVTMITDVVGFFSFLGLAAWWFGLW